ncbi:MAG: helix-turn-helix domain-containing protein [Rhizobium sp.]|nr:helix-turn-helix domain-containing protein [Rhizobium sp.]
MSDLTRAHREGLATTLLTKGTSKIADIAQALGYADGTAFCRAFKTWKGHAPSRRLQDSA